MLQGKAPHLQVCFYMLFSILSEIFHNYMSHTSLIAISVPRLSSHRAYGLRHTSKPREHVSASISCLYEIDLQVPFPRIGLTYYVCS